MRQRRPMSLLTLVVAPILVAACTTAEFKRQAAIPGTSTGGGIEFHGERDQYLDVTVTTGGTSYRFFLPKSEECRAVVDLGTGGEAVRYRNLGPFGRIEVGEHQCDAVGILSLVAWRNRGPRPQTRAAIPRDQATYETYYRDDEMALARGRFRLTAMIGIPGGVDYVAAIPNEERCQKVIDSTVASIEYRSSGPMPFVLLGGSRPCPVLGFAQVQPDQG